MGRPGVNSVIEMANLAGSGLLPGLRVGCGTGMYVLMRDSLDCFCMPYSGSGAELAWMLTAIPLKQGIVTETRRFAREKLSLECGTLGDLGCLGAGGRWETREASTVWPREGGGGKLIKLGDRSSDSPASHPCDEQKASG